MFTGDVFFGIHFPTFIPLFPVTVVCPSFTPVSGSCYAELLPKLLSMLLGFKGRHNNFPKFCLLGCCILQTVGRSIFQCPMDPMIHFPAAFWMDYKHPPVMGLGGWTCFLLLLYEESFFTGQHCRLLRKLHAPKNCWSCGGEWVARLMARPSEVQSPSRFSWYLRTVAAWRISAYWNKWREKGKWSYLDIKTRVWSWEKWVVRHKLLFWMSVVQRNAVPHMRIQGVRCPSRAGFSFFEVDRKFSKSCWGYSKVDLRKRMEPSGNRNRRLLSWDY